MATTTAPPTMATTTAPPTTATTTAPPTTETTAATTTAPPTTAGTTAPPTGAPTVWRENDGVVIETGGGSPDVVEDGSGDTTRAPTRRLRQQIFY
mmetsp:Transcript_4452/g.7605  ORF Transcript_4452/g.7605 Transcript_4452/m.7605 type:complete len:95 (-) Transcript_4452:70-354(-)